jgi:hypothetical protein
VTGGTPDEHLWERGWDGHSFAQRRRLARLTLREKIEWLEQAQRVVDHLSRDRARRGEDRPAPPES